VKAVVVGPFGVCTGLSLVLFWVAWGVCAGVRPEMSWRLFALSSMTVTTLSLSDLRDATQIQYSRYSVVSKTVEEPSFLLFI